MRQVIAAKRAGNATIMFPAGVASIEDLPCDLAMALEQAHRIITWQENLTKEEMPPKWMWHLEWELDAWFEEVERLREEKYGGGDDAREEAPMMRNDDPDLKARFGR